MVLKWAVGRKMDITPLDIKLIRQKPKSGDCLRCCALMVFNYTDSKSTKEEIWKKLHIYQKHSGLSGSYLTDLGKIALKKKHKVTIYHYATHWWDESAIVASKKGKKSLVSAQKELQKEKHTWGGKKVVKKEIDFVKSGGKFKVQVPMLDNIDYFLFQKIPVILNVMANNLYKSPKENYKHSIVVVGKRDGKYLIKDPYLAIDKIDEDELLYAWSRASGWMIAIFPKEEKPNAEQAKLKF